MGRMGTMTLLDAEPPKPRSRFQKLLPLIILLVVGGGGLTTYWLWDYPEERAVARFLNTLEEGKYQQAYRLWQPSPSFTFADFLHAWGEQGDYGKIREFTILHAKSKGSRTVIVTVRINDENPPLDLIVDRKTKGLAYSIFD
jgi:hypothetical protein